MKIPFIVLGFILSVLVACTSPVSSTPGGTTTPPTATPGKATHVSASVKGVYLNGSTTVAHSVMGRAVVTSGGAALGGILPSGVPTTLSFLDAQGQAVAATVDKAMQLTANYVLLSYTVGTASTVAVMDMTTGGLASLDVVPDVWGSVYALGASAWYEAGGAIVKVSLVDGNVVVLSTSVKVYQSVSNQSNTPTGAVGPWDTSAFIYADNGGTAYAVDLLNSGNIRGIAIAGNGYVTDIGASAGVYTLGNFVCGNTGTPSPFFIDPATNLPYWVTFPSENGWDAVHGWSYQTGWSVSTYPVTFSTTGVTFDTSAAPLSAYHLATLAELPDQTYMGRLGYGVTSSSAIWVDGLRAVTMSFSGQPVATVVDTSAVPQVLTVINGQRYPGVSNWKLVGGQLYYGPSTVQTIGIAIGGTPHTLVTASGTVSGWAVVGGVLFWSDSSGDWTAPVDTQAGTLGAVTPYVGGSVTGVTG